MKSVKLTTISYTKLPSKARALVSDIAATVCHFYRNSSNMDIEAWYAGVHLATWDGREWVSKIFNGVRHV